MGGEGLHGSGCGGRPRGSRKQNIVGFGIGVRPRRAGPTRHRRLPPASSPNLHPALSRCSTRPSGWARRRAAGFTSTTPAAARSQTPTWRPLWRSRARWAHRGWACQGTLPGHAAGACRGGWRRGRRTVGAAVGCAQPPTALPQLPPPPPNPHHAGRRAAGRRRRAPQAVQPGHCRVHPLPCGQRGLPRPGRGCAGRAMGTRSDRAGQLCAATL